MPVRSAGLCWKSMTISFSVACHSSSLQKSGRQNLYDSRSQRVLRPLWCSKTRGSICVSKTLTDARHRLHQPEACHYRDMNEGLRLAACAGCGIHDVYEVTATTAHCQPGRN